MKFLLLFGLVVVVHSANDVAAPLPSSRRMASPFDCREEMGYYCADCTSMKFCSGKVPEDFQVSCRDINPATPYCDPRNHVCSSIDMCVGMPSDFWCPDRGTYPDVTDCKRYVMCTGPNRTGSYYACLNNKTYDPISKSCVANSTCVSYSNKDGLCKNSHQILAHSDKTMFVQCMGAARPILRCCKGRFYMFNKAAMKCQFECQLDGRFTDQDDPHAFFQCDTMNGKYVKTKFACPFGQTFVSYGFNDGYCADNDDMFTARYPFGI